MRRPRWQWLGVVLLGLSFPLSAAEPSEEELERWFESDEPGPPQSGYGGGSQLEFIAPLTQKPTPLSHTQLLLDEASLATGWVAVEQCHNQLDPVPDAEVVYSFEQMRGLRITEQRGIASARVAGPSVQLRDVQRGARLCVALQARLLRADGPGRYRLRYGPFMRRFLDSYFPLHITLEVRYPAQRLELVQISPAAEEGYGLTAAPGRFSIDAWFRGKLVLELLFQRR